MSQNKSQAFGNPNKIVSRILDREQLLKQQNHQQSQNSSKQHPPTNLSYDSNLGFRIQNDHKVKNQQLKRFKQGKLIQSVLQNQQPSNKQSTTSNKKQQNNIKQREELNQFIYENQTHSFTVSRAKVPNKNQKFIDIEVHSKQNDLHYYKVTLKSNEIPQNIKKTGVVTANILFTKLQKFQSTFRIVDDTLKFSIFDKQQENVECTIEMYKIKLSKDLIDKHKFQLLQKENRILEKKLEQQKKNFQKQIQELKNQLQNEKQFKNNLLKENKILRLQKQQNGESGINVNNIITNNTHKRSTNSNTSNLANGNNNNLYSSAVVNVNIVDNDEIQIVPNNNVKPSHNNNANKDNQFSVLQIIDDSDDDKVQEISCQDHDSYYQDQKKKRSSTGKTKKTTKEVQPKVNFDYPSNDPYSLVHAVTGQVIHAGDLLKFRPKQPIYEKQVDQTLDAYRLRGGKPPRATQSISYNQRKSVWKQYGRKYKNKQFNDLIVNQVGYTQTKRLTKTNLNLPTMGFLQLFFQLLQIDLSSNKIQHIEGLYNCKKLRKLQLNNNLLTKIQGLDDQRELRELFLRENKIVKIEGIFHIKKLQSFSLQGNRIDEIPDNISDLQFLRTFYLNQNCIRSLPKSMASMNQYLKALRLSDNPQLNTNQASNKYVIDQLRKFGCNVFIKTLFQ